MSKMKKINGINNTTENPIIWNPKSQQSQQSEKSEPDNIYHARKHAPKYIL